MLCSVLVRIRWINIINFIPFPSDFKKKGKQSSIQQIRSGGGGTLTLVVRPLGGRGGGNNFFYNDVAPHQHSSLHPSIHPPILFLNFHSFIQPINPRNALFVSE